MKREHQSGIRYVSTERDMSAASGHIIRCPIRIFDLAGLGIDAEPFLEELAPTFDQLTWDPYDARRARVELLAERFPEEKERLELFQAKYYRQGDEVLDDISDLRAKLSPDDSERFDSFRSFRRRSIASFLITNRFTSTWQDQWHVVQTKIDGFAMDVEEDDPRKLVRVFDPTSVSVVQHKGFQRLILGIAEMVEDAESEFDLEPEEMEITFHQMGLVARPAEEVTNSPEGRHKDGSDYIVSAMVVERRNVQGGVSVITSDDPDQVHLRHELQPGQGIFQADQNSSLWHKVTAVSVECAEVARQAQESGGETNTEPGERNIFGFDVMVTSRVPRRTS